MFISVAQAMPEVIHTTDRNGFVVIESMEVLVKTNKGKHFVSRWDGDGWDYNIHISESVSITNIEKIGDVVSWKYVV